MVLGRGGRREFAMRRNYYLILGVTVEASLEEIKNAYRRLAKEFHPDYYGKDYTNFHAIQEAYEVLCDPERRRQHDLFIESEQRASVPLQSLSRKERGRGEVESMRPLAGSAFRPAAGLTSLQSIFGRVQRGFSRSAALREERQGTHSLVVSLTLEQARAGGYLRIMLPVRQRCQNCMGQGSVGWQRCRRCGGDGVFIRNTTMTVGYPAGITDKQRLRFSLEWSGIQGQDLIISFRVEEMMGATPHSI